MGRSDPDGGGLAAVVIGNILAFVGCLPLALPLGPHPAGDWGTILYLGVVQIGLAYVLVTSALEELPAFEASLILLLEPALNPLLAWLVHGEIPGGWALAGGAVILVGHDRQDLGGLAARSVPLAMKHGMNTTRC